MSRSNPIGPQPVVAPHFALDDPSHATRQELSKSLMEFGFRLIALAVLAMLKAEDDASAQDGGQFDNPWQRLDQLLQHLFAQAAGDAKDQASAPFDAFPAGWTPGPYAPPSPPSGKLPTGEGGDAARPPAADAPDAPDAPAAPRAPTPADVPASEAVRRPQRGQRPPEPTGIIDVKEPIIVKAGEVFDGKGKYYRPTSALGDGGQSENQLPVFILEPGATLKNVQYSGADGIHLLHDARLENVVNRDVGEDAITIDGEGNRNHDARLAGYPVDKIPSRRPRIEIVNSAFYGASDKVIQANGDADVSLKGVYVDGAGKVFRTNGGKDIEAHVDIQDSVFEHVKEAVFRTDSKRSTLKLARVDTTDTPFEALTPDSRQVKGAERVSYKPHSG